jgi:ketosteroid isomerase-like protein
MASGSGSAAGDLRIFMTLPGPVEDGRAYFGRECISIGYMILKRPKPRQNIIREGDIMDINRRNLTGSLPILGLAAFGLLQAKAAHAMSADEEAVAKRLEAFRAAQVAGDAKALAALCAPELSYSHSDAHVEDKATFIKNATSDKSKVLSLAYQDPTIRVVGDVAIVRFHWVGESESVPDGKKSSTNLHILMNWQKQGGEWMLLTRASTKL